MSMGKRCFFRNMTQPRNDNLYLWQITVIFAPLVFYGYWDVRFVALLAGLTVANWLIVRLFGRHRHIWILDLGIAMNRGTLAVFNRHSLYDLSCKPQRSPRGLPFAIPSPARLGAPARPVEFGLLERFTARLSFIKAHLSRCLSFPPSPPASSRSWRCPKSSDQPQNLFEQFSWHCDLGQLEDDGAAVSHDLGADLHQLLAQRGE